jgi:adenine-specific DNA-methyltransferase
MSTQQAITERVPRTTPPLPAERLAALRDLIPEAFTEGRVDWEKLRAALGDLVDERPERYAFTWAGKRDAIRMLQAPSRATLVADREASVSFDTTEHVFIEGENLEVLKLLYKPYFGRVKMIYIDPPYNTGNDFVYPDNFADPLDSYLRLSGQRDAEGNLLTSNPETSGRYHSAWLSMMYPRLFLARQLLREDGVIFVSIDDHEVHNLRMLMNEVFGEENHYATIAWQKRDTPSNDAKGVSVNHEYVVVYRRSASFERNLIPRTDAQLLNYKNPDSDPRGPWIRTSLIRKQVRSGRIFPLTNPAGREVRPPPGTSWRVPQETFARLQVDNRLWWGLDGNGDLPFKKRFLSEVQEGTVPVSWWDYEYAGSNRNAKMELRALFERQAPFETPKPSSLVRRMLEIATTPTAEDIILDFFAGSATTA